MCKDKGIEEKIDYNKGNIITRKIAIAKPKVLIPIFTGSHGEYDMTSCFQEAGAKVDTFVFKSLTLNQVSPSKI